VRINGDKTDAASATVKPGDTLTITLDRRILILKVLASGTRRGPYEEARLLYDDLSPAPVAKSDTNPVEMPPLRDAGTGRPTKRERRQLDREREKWNSAEGD
jgi:ribosome-associated heat shock protein Hsp15